MEFLCKKAFYVQQYYVVSVALFMPPARLKHMAILGSLQFLLLLLGYPGIRMTMKGSNNLVILSSQRLQQLKY